MPKSSGRTTIHDIAHELGLNASTISRALNDNPAVSKRTREIIQAKAREMNYRPNHIAAALRKGRSDILGVIIPAVDRTFFASVIRGIEEEADKVGLRVIVCQSYDDSQREKQMVETLQRLQVDGIMISMAKDGKSDLAFYRQIIASGLPIQFFDNVPQEVDMPSVVINDQQGAYAATAYLIKQGYQRIAHLRGPQHLHIYRDRYRGYLDAMREAGRPTPEEYIVDIVSHFDSGKEAFRQLWSLNNQPDAIFSASDYSAAGGIKAAQLLGIQVPEEIAFVGFANEPFTELITPSLTSVDQQTVVMGQRTARRTIEAIRNKNALAVFNERLVLAPKLIIRGSS
ncbi:MAG: LacI family DNA-binding transcriptional regulator [Bacteroidota bacterium]